MVRIVLALVISIGILVCPAVAQEKVIFPEGTPPLMRTVNAINKDKAELNILEIQTKVYTETVVYQEKQNDGSVVEKVKRISKTLFAKESKKLSLDSAEVFDVVGNKLTKEEVVKRLSPGATILVSANGKKVDGRYLSVIIPETLVFLSAEYVTQPDAPVAPVAPAGRGANRPTRP